MNIEAASLEERGLGKRGVRADNIQTGEELFRREFREIMGLEYWYICIILLGFFLG
jgi:hypothetical protein